MSKKHILSLMSEQLMRITYISFAILVLFGIVKVNSIGSFLIMFVAIFDLIHVMTEE